MTLIHISSQVFSPAVYVMSNMILFLLILSLLNERLHLLTSSKIQFLRFIDVKVTQLPLLMNTVLSLLVMISLMQ